MKIVTKILSVISLIGGFFSAIFFFLYEAVKKDKALIQEELKEVADSNKVYSDIKQAEEFAEEKVKESKNDEKRKNYNSGANLNNFNDGVSISQK